MSKIITNDYGEQYQTPGFWKTTGAVLAGGAVSGAVNSTFRNSQMILISKLKKTSGEIDKKTLRKGVSDAFEASGLKKHGVKIIDASNVKPQSIMYSVKDKPVGGGRFMMP